MTKTLAQSSQDGRGSALAAGTPATATASLALPSRYFPPGVYAGRRARLLQAMRAAGGGVAMLASAPTAMRTAASEHPYRQSSGLLYLTGFDEADALLLLDAREGAAHPCTLLCRERDSQHEIWEGKRHGLEGAHEQFGFDAVAPIQERDAYACGLLEEASTLFYPFSDRELGAACQGWLATLRGKRGAPPTRLIDLSALLDGMRLVKDEHELETMRRAGQISAHGHLRAMRACRVGMREFELEAELLYEFRRAGAQASAYPAIVASGANACVLHYPAGDGLLCDGDLVLIDAGCELDGYAGDITRTFPANGRFSAAQRDLYDIVFAAQAAAIEATRAGARLDDGHAAAVRVLAQGMLDTGLLDRAQHGGLDDVLASRAYSRFYMHRTGHWLGLDVHDVGEYLDAPQAGEESAVRRSRTLEAGMVVTIEPGIYVRAAADIPPAFHDIGIRLEDDAIVTASGCELITRDVPADAAGIEALMRARDE